MTASPWPRRSRGSGRSGGANCHPRDHLPDLPDPLDLLDFDGLAHNPCERPPFPPAHRTRLDDGHGVADLCLVLLVVNHELRRAPLGLAVEPVSHLPLDGDDAAL